MVPINPKPIAGNWAKGVALDMHTLKSTPRGANEQGHMQFDTIRTPIADLLYRLKYNSDQTAAPPIIAAAAGFLNQYASRFDMIIPVPPSKQRAVQPVLVLAAGIGEAVKLPIVPCVASLRPSAQIKNVTDTAQRKTLLAGAFSLLPGSVVGKSIILFDDVYDSGSTLYVITELLLKQGQAKTVNVLTITRTKG